MKLGEYDAAWKFIENHQDNGVKQRLLTYYHMMTEGEFGEIQEEDDNEESQNELIKILDLLNNGYIYYLKSGDIQNAYRNFRSIIDITKGNQEKTFLCEATKGILGIYDRFLKTVREESYNYFLKVHKKNAYDQYEKEFNLLYDYRINLRVFSDQNEKTKEIDDKKEKANQFILGSFQDINTKLYLTNSSYYLQDSLMQNNSLQFINLSKGSIITREDYFAAEDAISLKIQEAIFTYQMGKAKEAIKILEETEINENQGFVFRRLNMYRYFSLKNFYEKLGEKNQYEKYSELYDKTDNSLNDVKNRESVVLMEENKQVEEIKLESQRTLLYMFLLLVSLLSITLLSLKNSRKKRLLAVQEKEIEVQKNLTLLKEQEIGIINAMIEGQEKERQQVAEDLHDNLGSAIATLKLHIENLKLSLNKKKVDKELLFSKTEDLIEEAYQKVRSIAHVKNSGVIANEGLLVAIQLMAEKVSAANSIDIDVIHFGLEKHLENSLEISLFRMVQELTTNIIKHADASHATINISQDKEGITLLVEDDGIGMDTSTVSTTYGMGLHSIETRVEHLAGQFTIDSTPTKGTTIIIQIPS